jgi:hypothetical protein
MVIGQQVGEPQFLDALAVKTAAASPPSSVWGNTTPTRILCPNAPRPSPIPRERASVVFINAVARLQILQVVDAVVYM